MTSGGNPRADFGLTNLDNRHGFTAAGNWEPRRGLGLGATFTYYTGNPVNELVGDDVNNDLDTFDRPTRGRDDARTPILSEVDANGYAIHNTMPGHSDFLALNLRVQYASPGCHGSQTRRLLGAVQPHESQQFRQPVQRAHEHLVQRADQCRLATHHATRTAVTRNSRPQGPRNQGPGLSQESAVA